MYHTTIHVEHMVGPQLCLLDLLVVHFGALDASQNL
jgi:hypothetical protein